jgi:hypothetical protein
MAKKNKEIVLSENSYVPTDTLIESTVGKVRELSKQVGSRIFWRPEGKPKHKNPDDDMAIIFESIGN